LFSNLSITTLSKIWVKLQCKPDGRSASVLLSDNTHEGYVKRDRCSIRRRHAITSRAHIRPLDYTNTQPPPYSVGVHWDIGEGFPPARPCLPTRTCIYVRSAETIVLLATLECSHCGQLSTKRGTHNVTRFS